MNRNSFLILVVVAVVGFGIHYQFNRPQAVQPGAGAPLVNVVVPQLTAAEAEGEIAYAQNCAACHGKNGAGQDGVAPPLVHKIYEPSHHGDQAFVMAVRNGVRAHHWTFGDMPKVEGIGDEDVSAIIAYVRALQRENGI